MFTYIQSEPQLWTVGHYASGNFVPESDWGTPKEAGDRVRFLNGGPPAPSAPSAVVLDLAWWINNHEQQCRIYMDGLNSIQADMETRDHLVRREVEWEHALKACEAGAILNADDEETGIYTLAKATKRRRRGTRNWYARTPRKRRASSRSTRRFARSKTSARRSSIRWCR